MEQGQTAWGVYHNIPTNGTFKFINSLTCINSFHSSGIHISNNLQKHLFKSNINHLKTVNRCDNIQTVIRSLMWQCPSLSSVHGLLATSSSEESFVQDSLVILKRKLKTCFFWIICIDMSSAASNTQPHIRVKGLNMS